MGTAPASAATPRADGTATEGRDIGLVAGIETVPPAWRPQACARRRKAQKRVDEFATETCRSAALPLTRVLHAMPRAFADPVPLAERVPTGVTRGRAQRGRPADAHRHRRRADRHHLFRDRARVTGRTAAHEAFGTCTEGSLSGGNPQVQLMGEGEVVQRIGVGPGVRTASGVAIGDSETRVRQVYLGVEERPSYYLPDGHWLVVHPAGSPYELLFETDGTRVIALRTGLTSYVEAPEGCH